MPPIGQSAMDFSNISDADLSQMLKDYGVNVGPINAATRKTYERKLVQLKTGKLPPSSQPPVDDDEEVQIRQPEPPRRPVQNTSESTYPYVSSLRDSGFSASPKSYTSTSSGRDSDFSASRSYGYSAGPSDLTPDVRSRPSLPADRRTPSTYSPSSYSTPDRMPVTSKVPTEKSNSIPVWLKLVAVAIVGTLIYLIYINMEPAAVSNIPEIQNKLEV